MSSDWRGNRFRNESEWIWLARNEFQSEPFTRVIVRTIFFFTNSCEPELAHRLQTSKMRRNSTSLDSCQHDDINIVTVSVARRRWTTPLKPRRPCVKHFTTFYALLKHVSPKGDHFTPKSHFFAPHGHYFAHWCENRSFSLSVNGA